MRQMALKLTALGQLQAAQQVVVDSGAGQGIGKAGTGVGLQAQQQVRSDFRVSQRSMCASR